MRMLINELKNLGIHNQDVLAAIEQTPRHWFIKNKTQNDIYSNQPLPIGQQQTMSSPYIVARMTSLLLSYCHQRHHILEVGTGSGYQAAILSHFFEHVDSIERIKTLYDSATKTLQKHHFDHVTTHWGDATQGWGHQRFDAMIITAEPAHFPSSLLQNLAPESVMLLPYAQTGASTKLYLIQKKRQSLHVRTYDPVRFVPMLSGTC